MSGDDPFGRKGEERTDAFGRPLGQDPSSESAASPASGPAWEPPPQPAPPPAQGGFAPPTDAPAPDTSQWWTDSAAGTIEGRAHGGGSTAGHAPAEYLERAGAALLDGVVRVGIFLVGVLVGAVAYLAGDAAGEVGITIGIVVGGVVANVVYAPYMIATRNGQTFGHKALGIRVATRRGGPVGGGKAFVREVLVKAILFEGLAWFTFGIGILLNYLWPLWDDKNEALHDKMCDTRMLKA